jgi:hypothetical protein
MKDRPPILRKKRCSTVVWQIPILEANRERVGFFQGVYFLESLFLRPDPDASLLINREYSIPSYFIR